MTYGIQLLGTVKKSNLSKFQAFQSINPRLPTNCPWYVRNLTLHNDLNLIQHTPLSHPASTNNFPKILFTPLNLLRSNLSSPNLPGLNPPRHLIHKLLRDLLVELLSNEYIIKRK